MDNGVTIFQVEGPKAALLAGAVGVGLYFKDDITNVARDVGTSLALVASNFFGRQQHQVTAPVPKLAKDIAKEFLAAGRSENAVALNVYTLTDEELTDLVVNGVVDESKLAALLETKQRGVSTTTTTPDPMDDFALKEEEPVELPKTAADIRAIFQDGDENQVALLQVEKELGELVDVRLTDTAIQRAYAGADFLAALLANCQAALDRVRGDFEQNSIDPAAFKGNEGLLNDYQQKVIFKIMSQQPVEAFEFPKQAEEEQPLNVDDFSLLNTRQLEREESVASLRAEEEEVEVEVDTALHDAERVETEDEMPEDEVLEDKAGLKRLDEERVAEEKAELERLQADATAFLRDQQEADEARRRLEAETAAKGPKKAEALMKVEAPKRRKEKKPVKPVIQPVAKARTWEVFKAGITVREEDGFFKARVRNIGKIFAVVLFPFTLLFRFAVCPLIDRCRNVSDETAKVNHKVAEKKREGKVAV